MKIQITQETFDAAVAENVELLDMSPEEAVAEAIKQFEAQGANLDTVVKEVCPAGSSSGDGSGPVDHVAVAAVKQLQAAVQQQPVSKDDILVACGNLREVCKKTLAERCLAAKNGGFEALMSALDAVVGVDQMLPVVLAALECFVDGQPDVVSEAAMGKFVGMLRLDEDGRSAANVILAGVLRVIRVCCVMHETNRQTLVGGFGLVDCVSRILHDPTIDRDVVRAACSVYSSLTLDDDIRVAFGKGHDHAKLIVIEGKAVSALFNLAKAYCDDAEVLADLFGVVARLCVRDEFCQQVAEMDGINTVFETLQRHTGHQGLVKSLLVFIKVLAGSDRVKVEVTRVGGIALIFGAIQTHHRNAAICEAGCAAVGAVVLRHPAHCDAVIEAGGPEIVCTAMELHANSVAVQTQACTCIRNVVARRSDLTDAFLSLGAERLLRRTMAKHQSCHDEAKSALRDLDCHVDLKELWTGSGRELARD